MSEQNMLGENEYINEQDGLIYCSKCHTPRQYRFTWLGQIRTPRMMCRCQTEEADRKREEQAKRDFMDKVSRMKAAGLQDRSLREFTFANDRGINPEISRAHEYVNHWPEMKEKNMGLLLWGDVGTGKSFFAGCIANALIEQGVPVLMTNFARILNTLTGMTGMERNEFVDSLSRYPLLILDDLGMERSSEFALEQVFHVIDSRYRSKLPMIVTTNLTLDEIKHPADLAHERIYDRVMERCVPVKINRQNIRTLNAAEQMKEARKLLASGTD